MKAGDRQIFSELFNEYYEPLCRACLRYLPDQQEAEEIVQDLFVALWEKRNELNIGKSVSGYLFKSVANKALNYQMHQKIRRIYTEHVKSVTHESADSIDLVIRNELVARYETIVARMPDKRKQVFQLSRKEGLKYAEIAERMSISVKTVEVHLSKALQELRLKLRDYLPAALVIMHEIVTMF